ncbi:MAG: polysaccharide export protein [Candidatus Omnitrophica bacterium]|nr:polysaccharide export protein [Candidatus Omnitrophota bacterium]
MKIFLFVSSFLLCFLALSFVSGNATEKIQTVQTGDELKITVYREEDLSGAYQVRNNGTIEFPLLGSVSVEGLSTLGVSKKISQLLEADYLVNPSVSASIGTSTNRTFTVMGNVTKPGSYALPEDKTINTLEAIAIAGGFDRYANPNGTKIIRTMPDGEKKALDPNLKLVLKGQAEDIDIEKSDIIIVPESSF